MKTKLILYLTLFHFICNSCTNRQNSKNEYDYTGYGFFYFTSDNGHKFELRFIPVDNSWAELKYFNSKLRFKTGLSFLCDLNDTGLVSKIRYYAKRECQIVVNDNYTANYNSIAYYIPVFISYRFRNDINSTDSFKMKDEFILKNNRKDIVKLNLIDLNKDIFKLININKIIYLDTALTDARKKFGFVFNKERQRLSLPDLSDDLKYKPSFTVGNTVQWENDNYKSCPTSILGAKSVAYSNDNCILSELNLYCGPLISGNRQMLFETFYFKNTEGWKKHSREYSFSLKPNHRMLTRISELQADSIMKVWGFKSYR